MVTFLREYRQLLSRRRLFGDFVFSGLSYDNSGGPVFSALSVFPNEACAFDPRCHRGTKESRETVETVSGHFFIPTANAAQPRIGAL